MTFTDAAHDAHFLEALKQGIVLTSKRIYFTPENIVVDRTGLRILQVALELGDTLAQGALASLCSAGFSLHAGKDLLLFGSDFLVERLYPRAQIPHFWEVWLKCSQFLLIFGGQLCTIAAH